MWRFVRIAHGFLETTADEGMEAVAKGLKAREIEIMGMFSGVVCVCVMRVLRGHELLRYKVTLEKVLL